MADESGAYPLFDLNPVAVAETLREVARERASQHRKWGQQDHPNGTGSAFAQVAQEARENCAAAFAQGDGTWRDILVEEVYEALAESDPALLRAELVQVAAVAAAWIEAIDRRTASDETGTVHDVPYDGRPHEWETGR